MNTFSIILPYINEKKSLNETLNIIHKQNQKVKIEYLIVISKKLTNKVELDKLKKIKKIHKNKKIKIYFQNLPFVGGAIKKGIKNSKNSHIVIMASDLETNPNDLKKMIYLSNTFPKHIICADRWKIRKNILFKKYGFFKKYFNFIFQVITSMLYKTKFADFTFAYRIYPSRALKNFDFRENRHSFALEMILRPIKAGYKIKTTHTTWVARNEGLSNNSIINYFHYLKTLIKIKFFTYD